MAKHKHQKAEKRLEEVMRGMSNLQININEEAQQEL